jgi:hypothetical protein
VRSVARSAVAALSCGGGGSGLMPSVAPASEGSSDSSLDDSEVWQDCSSCSSTLEDAEEQLEREQHTAADARSDWRPTEADIAAAASAPVLVAAHPGLPYQQILSGSPQDLPVNTGRCGATPQPSVAAACTCGYRWTRPA